MSSDDDSNEEIPGGNRASGGQRRRDGGAEPVENKRQKLMKSITESSKPHAELEAKIQLVMKKIVDHKMFPRSEFLMSEKEVEGGFVQLAFIELGWGKEGRAEHAVRRARHWRAAVEFIIKRVADRRAAATAAIKKACVGKQWCVRENAVWLS